VRPQLRYPLACCLWRTRPPWIARRARALVPDAPIDARRPCPGRAARGAPGASAAGPCPGLGPHAPPHLSSSAGFITGFSFRSLRSLRSRGGRSAERPKKPVTPERGVLRALLGAELAPPPFAAPPPPPPPPPLSMSSVAAVIYEVALRPLSAAPARMELGEPPTGGRRSAPTPAGRGLPGASAGAAGAAAGAATAVAGLAARAASRLPRARVWRGGRSQAP